MLVNPGPQGEIISIPGIGHALCAGTTVPADNTAGFATGCLFLHVDLSSPGASNVPLYVNEGDEDACNFDQLEDI